MMKLKKRGEFRSCIKSHRISPNQKTINTKFGVDMFNPNFFLEQNIQNKTVLVAALDWGMGHTTRCYSIVSGLLAQGNKVIFAGNEQQRQWMRREFPKIQTEALNGYEIRLDSQKNTYIQLIKQFGALKKSMRFEHKWLLDFCQQKSVDLVISDNRYGLFHPEIKSILVTHQLNLQIPFFRNITNKKLRQWVEKFDAIWIPDTPDHKLAGELSTAKLTVPQYFIGALNRFPNLEQEIKYDYLVILSGPEPERSRFLNQALVWGNKTQKRIAFVGETVKDCHSIKNPSTTELAMWISKSETVVSRAGYTTIMEMVGLNQKAILIPTKGQYEQEYLATLKYENSSFFKSLMEIKSD